MAKYDPGVVGFQDVRKDDLLCSRLEPMARAKRVHKETIPQALCDDIFLSRRAQTVHQPNIRRMREPVIQGAVVAQMSKKSFGCCLGGTLGRAFDVVVNCFGKREGQTSICRHCVLDREGRERRKRKKQKETAM